MGAATGQRHWRSVSISYKYIQQCTNTVQHQIQIYPTLHKYTTNISNSTQIKIEKYKYIQQCTNTNTSNSAQIEKQIQMYPTVHKYNTASVTMIYNSAQIQYRISHKYTQQCKNTKINNSAQLQICPTMHKYKLKLEWHSAVQYWMSLVVASAGDKADGACSEFDKVKDDARTKSELVCYTFDLSEVPCKLCRCSIEWCSIWCKVAMSLVFGSAGDKAGACRYIQFSAQL